MIICPSFTVQGHKESDPFPACTGQETGKHPGQVIPSIVGLKETHNRLHVWLRCLKMSAHDYRHHVLSGSLAAQQMVLVLHSCWSQNSHPAGWLSVCRDDPSTTASEFKSWNWSYLKHGKKKLISLSFNNVQYTIKLHSSWDTNQVILRRKKTSSVHVNNIFVRLDPEVAGYLTHTCCR